MMRKTLLSFGYGFSAQALAADLMAQGWDVIGTTRDPAKAYAIAKTGATPLLWGEAQTDQEGILEAIARASHVLVSAAPTAEGDPVLNAFGAALTARAGAFEWLGYMSTTGVYGDHAGGWVDENSPLTPSTARGKLRVAAETQWRKIPNVPLHIFRLAGIYGPGRGPFAKVRAGTARRIPLGRRSRGDASARANMARPESPARRRHRVASARRSARRCLGGAGTARRSPR